MSYLDKLIYLLKLRGEFQNLLKVLDLILDSLSDIVRAALKLFLQFIHLFLNRSERAIQFIRFFSERVNETSGIIKIDRITGMRN